jgi:DNA-binding response OmpR family regulator
MRILLIEDDLSIAQTIRDGIKNQHVVDIAHDGQKGLSQAETNQYDTIILDVTLPDIDGIQICHQLRADHITTPILMLTGKDSIQDKVQALDAGADDYLTKPFHFAELQARLRALHRRPTKTFQKNRVTVGELSIDPVNRLVTHGTSPIELRRKEFLLLEYLMRHANQVVTRNMILEHVWEEDADPSTNTIDVHIKYLRDKIDKPFGTKHLKTVHGLGYKLIDL